MLCKDDTKVEQAVVKPGTIPGIQTCHSSFVSQSNESFIFFDMPALMFQVPRSNPIHRDH